MKWALHMGLLVAALCLCSARASSTLCSFEPGVDQGGYELEFIGDERVNQIQVNTPAGQRIRLTGQYQLLEFNLQTARIHLVYRSTGGPDDLPSFVLRGMGGDTRMTLGTTQIRGTLSCGA